jgi:hypothetical protein
MPLLSGVDEKRHFPVPRGKEFLLDTTSLTEDEKTLYSLDDLSEALNLIDPETFKRHVNPEKNDFANWVEYVFEEKELASSLRNYPTPLRMMVSIERFLQ